MKLTGNCPASLHFGDRAEVARNEVCTEKKLTPARSVKRLFLETHDVVVEKEGGNDVCR